MLGPACPNFSTTHCFVLMPQLFLTEGYKTNTRSKISWSILVYQCYSVNVSSKNTFFSKNIITESRCKHNLHKTKVGNRQDPDIRVLKSG